MEFRVKEDIYLFDNLLFREGENIFIPMSGLEFEKSNIKLKLSLDEILNDPRFEKIDKILFNIESQEIDTQEDLQIKQWKMVLNIRTNRKKLIEIEKQFREILDQII